MSVFLKERAEGGRGNKFSVAQQTIQVNYHYSKILTVKM